MTSKIAITSISLICSACNTTIPDPTIKNQTKFDAKAAAYIHKSGKGRIKGEAFVVAPNGRVIYAAGELIRLIPATAYARQRMSQLYKNKRFVQAAEIPKLTHNKEYVRLTRTTVANARGKFVFENVSSGKYFITAQKIIRKPNSLTPLGGAMYTSVQLDVKKSALKNVIVAGK